MATLFGLARRTSTRLRMKAMAATILAAEITAMPTTLTLTMTTMTNWHGKEDKEEERETDCQKTRRTNMTTRCRRKSAQHTCIESILLLLKPLSDMKFESTVSRLLASLPPTRSYHKLFLQVIPTPSDACPFLRRTEIPHHPEFEAITKPFPVLVEYLLGRIADLPATSTPTSFSRYVLNTVKRIIQPSSLSRSTIDRHRAIFSRLLCKVWVLCITLITCRCILPSIHFLLDDLRVRL